MRNILLAIRKTLIRILAFIRKELFSILRQPQLFLILVLGPFLILLIFGIGYRNEARSMRTLFVAPAGSRLAQEVENYATTLGPQLVYMGVTDDTEAALARLANGEVELVAVTPDDAMTSIRAGEHAKFILYHREIDPVQVNYVSFFGEIYIAEVNRRVLREITTQGQAEAATLEQDLEAARENTNAPDQAVQAGDETAARQHLSALSTNMDNISLAMGASLMLLNSVESTMGEQDDQQAGEIMGLLSNMQTLAGDMQNQEITDENQGELESQVSEIDSNLSDLESQLETFTQLNPDVVVQPFISEARNIATVQPDATGYYAPAVIALLLQHLAVTIAALSVVQESNYGTLELFRVAPLSAAETLIGKYISYLLFGVVIATVLALLLHFGLNVPMLGHWVNYALVMFVLLFTSLGIGFIISLIARSDSQAVQYTMIVLLASVFFSGFLMRLDMLWQPVRVLSWMIPTTYGSVLLREIALRGAVPDLLLLGGLAAIGVGLCIMAWLLLRRRIANH